MIHNLGSINIDHVYQVPYMPGPGETLTALSYARFLGGKGVNTSVAIAMAGGEVAQLGAVGSDGAWALAQIADFGVETDTILRLDEVATGNAVIYVDPQAENQIVICGGANQVVPLDYIELQLAEAEAGSWAVLQNETNNGLQFVERAKAKGLKVAYAAAPFIADIAVAMLDTVDLIAVNETEAAQLVEATGKSVQDLGCDVLMTRGAQGADYYSGGQVISQAAFKVEPVDTTGAGDTFFGSFLAELASTQSVERALRYGSAAAALQVTRPGAAAAIPARDEVELFLMDQ